MALPPPKKEVNRKLKPHKKSRGGCGNCKLRAVKCDESKPRCKRCSAYGVACNYDSKSPDLQPLVDGAFNVEVLRRFSCSLNQAIPSMIFPQLRQLSAASEESNAFYLLRNQDLELLRKFQSRTVLTMSTDKSLPIYQYETIKIAFIHPFLMHAVLLLTLMHDRHLSAKENTRLSPTEAFHWYRSTALFNSKLSGPIQDSERDALWIAAALLGTATFYYIEASTPEEAWPLKTPSSLGLNWLRMSAGKEEIWRITQPMRPDSAFRALVTEAGNFLPIPTTVSRLEALPSELIKLFNLDATSNNKDNPYRAPASSLAGIMNSDCSLSIILSFLYFINHMHPEFKRLLERKDPRALLLLAYWFAKVFQSQHWWVWRRAALECQAICIYLERYHTNESCIQELLQFPKLVCAIDGYHSRNGRN